MPMRDVAAALQRLRSVLLRRPELGIHDDAPATVSWETGTTRMVATHANGAKMTTDMPRELGGKGEGVTPGWLFRAGIGSCAATNIALAAATKDLELTVLEVQVSSRSDTRGVLAMEDASGEMVFAGPSDLMLHVRIAATGATQEQLRALVQDGLRCSPIPNAVESATPIAVKVETA